MLQLVDIQKSFHDYKVLRGINVTIDQGEIVGLLGENGVGKTTLLKIICGISLNHQGEIRYQDHVVDNYQDFKSKLGFLSERNPLYPHMYIREYLSYIALHYSLSNPKDRIEQVIEMVDIADQVGLKIDQLSKGFKQRVGLASALLHDPKILVLDEPINGLDPKQILHYRALLKNMSEDRIIILSSHLIQEIEALCDRVLFISEGVISNDQKLNNHSFGSIAFILNTAKPVDIKLLLELSEIAEVKKLGELRYMVISSSSTDARHAVFQFLASKNNYMMELRPDVQNLNQLFLD